MQYSGAKKHMRKIAMLFSAALVLGFASATAASTTPAQAANNASFNPGNIIADSEFYNGSSMSVADIQNFLNSKLPTCEIGRSKAAGTYYWTHTVTAENGSSKQVVESVASTCLKDYRTSSYTVAANSYCNQYVGQSNESAAQIIAKVGQACGINPKALLVTLQKEMSFITDSWPTDYMYDYAVGYGCNDSGPGFSARCQERYKSFFVQIYNAAWQFKHYANASIGWKFKAGNTTSIQYNPNPACGSSPVYIQGRATAALYNYTPYQPNASALAGGNDGCGAYGNLNFWRLYTDWFPLLFNLDNITAVPGGFSVSGWAIDPTDSSTSVNVRIEVSGLSSSILANTPRQDVSVAYPGYGLNHGFETTISSVATGTQEVCVYGSTSSAYALIGCRSIEMYPPGFQLSSEASRLYGNDRYQTAVEISKANWGGGLSGDTVYVAVGTNYPDALSAAPAASKSGGPLLLTPSNELPQIVRDEILRLQPKNIVVVGGPSVIAENVYNQLSMLTQNIRREYGDTRYETSQLLANQTFHDSQVTDLYLATGENYPDALSASAVSGSKLAPMLLVQGTQSKLDTEVLSTVRSLNPQKISIVGGTAVISLGIENQLKTEFGASTIVRLSGEDRYETSFIVNQEVEDPQGAFIATGLSFPDALTGSVYAATTSSRLYLAPDSCMPRNVIDSIAAKYLIQKTTVLGGTSALNENVQKFSRC